MESKAREWWIDDVDERTCGRWDHPVFGIHTMPWPDSEEVIHVIEYSAYEREQNNFSDLVQKYTDVTLKYSKTVDDLVAERARSAKVVEALYEVKTNLDGSVAIMLVTDHIRELVDEALAEYSGGEGEK